MPRNWNTIVSKLNKDGHWNNASLFFQWKKWTLFLTVAWFLGTLTPVFWGFAWLILATLCCITVPFSLWLWSQPQVKRHPAGGWHVNMRQCFLIQILWKIRSSATHFVFCPSLHSTLLNMQFNFWKYLWCSLNTHYYFSLYCWNKKCPISRNNQWCCIP